MPGDRSARPARVIVSLTLALAVMSVVARGQGRPPTTTTGAPAGETQPATGVILGRVIDGDTGRPVPGAIVILGGGPRPAAAAAATADLMLAQQLAAAAGGRAAPAQLTPVMSNADGRFMFRDLARGTYNLSAQASGYAPGIYGRQRPDGPPRGIDLAQDERLTDVVVRVWKYAVVSGTVTDEVGEPVVGAQVRALRRMTVGGTNVRYQASASATTDDRGIFRLATLVPGQYLIAAPSTVTTMPMGALEEYQQSMVAGTMESTVTPRIESGAPTPVNGIAIGNLQLQQNTSRGASAVLLADGRVGVYPTTFHPAARTSTTATVLTLTSGEQRDGVDVQIRLVTGVRVSGTAMGLDGPAKNMGVRLVPAGESVAPAAGFEAGATATNASGQFTFVGITPGAYVISMYHVPRTGAGQMMTMINGVPAAAGAPAPAPTVPASWGEQPITVGGEDIDGVSVVMRPGAEVSGHLEFEGATPRPPAQRLRVPITLSPADGRTVQIPTATADNRTADAEGRFKTPGYPPGRYWLTVGTPGPEWAVKSISVDGVDALSRPIELTASPISGVVVTFTDRVSQLSGTVQGDPAAVDGASIVIVPGDFQAWIERGMSPRLQFSATTSKTGTFQVRIPVAGEYLVAALSPDTPVDNTTAFFAALARVATRVTLTEGDTRSVILSVSRLR